MSLPKQNFFESRDGELQRQCSACLPPTVGWVLFRFYAKCGSLGTPVFLPPMFSILILSC